MSELMVNEKDIVVPGEVIANGMEFLPSKGTYRFNDNIIANTLGVVHIDGKVIKLIPLSGIYNPKVNDTVICQVIDILLNGWRLDTNSAYSAVLPLQDATNEFIKKGADLTQYFDLGDYVVGKISNVTSQRLIDISMKGPGLRKLNGGRIIKVNAHKVPRVIGRQGSMVSMIKKATNTQITVGQNGLIWISSQEPEMEIKAVNIIEKIVLNAHVEGLTDQIKNELGLTDDKTPETADNKNTGDEQ